MTPPPTEYTSRTVGTICTVTIRGDADDTLITATADRYGMVVATRNLRDFAFAAIAAVSPWVARNPKS